MAGQLKPIFSLCVLLLVGLSTSGHGAEISDDDLGGLGRDFARAINQRQAGALDALISNSNLSDRVAELVVDHPKDRADFVRGFQQGIATLSQRMVDEMDGMVSRFSCAYTISTAFTGRWYVTTWKVATTTYYWSRCK